MNPLRNGLLQELFSELGYTITAAQATAFIKSAGKSAASASRNLLRAWFDSGNTSSKKYATSRTIVNLWEFLAGIQDMDEFFDRDQGYTRDNLARAEGVVESALFSHETLSEIFWD